MYNLGASGAMHTVPLVHAGAARGPVLSRGGDFYGAPVNLASRITDVARPGSVLVTEDVRAEAEGRSREMRRLAAQADQPPDLGHGRAHAGRGLGDGVRPQVNHDARVCQNVSGL